MTIPTSDQKLNQKTSILKIGEEHGVKEVNLD